LCIRAGEEEDIEVQITSIILHNSLSSYGDGGPNLSDRDVQLVNGWKAGDLGSATKTQKEKSQDWSLLSNIASSV
jgi:hypothetical protein